MAKPKVTTVLGIALDILQMACALVVIIFTSWKLFDVDVEGVSINSDCLLDGSGSGERLSGAGFCIYAIAVGVVSFVANAIFGCIRNIVKCFTLNACGASKIVAIVGDAALAVWWAVAFALFVQRGVSANNKGWPEQPARDGVISASFFAMTSFIADVLVTVCGMVLE